MKFIIFPRCFRCQKRIWFLWLDYPEGYFHGGCKFAEIIQDSIKRQAELFKAFDLDLNSLTKGGKSN